MSKSKIEKDLSELINEMTFNDYLNRLTKICLSIFEWQNLPKSMNAMALEKSLFYHGQASILKDENFGIINTNCSDNGYVNIYEYPTKLNCYSHQYQAYRNLYTGLDEEIDNQKEDCILVQNNWERVGTFQTIQLFAQRLYECQRTLDINLQALKTPLIILCNQTQLTSMKNTILQYQNNAFAIFGDKDNLDENSIRTLDTGVPFYLDKISDYKKEIWNECLTFLGINNIINEKKERMINDEVNSNNELINLNLQSYLAPRKLACDQFNELFDLKNTQNEISVRVRSDLHNIIKNAESIINDYKDLENLDENIEILNQKENFKEPLSTPNKEKQIEGISRIIKELNSRGEKNG